MDEENISSTVTFPPGTAVIRQGEESRTIYYWKAGGRVRVVVDRQVIRELDFDPQTPHFFGDLAALLGRPRSSSVETLTECTFLRIPYEAGKIEAFLKAAPPIAWQWLLALARTAHDAADALRDKEQALDEAKRKLSTIEEQQHDAKKKWSGALFLTDKAVFRTSNAAVEGLRHYWEVLSLFGTKRGRALDMQSDLIPPELKQLLF